MLGIAKRLVRITLLSSLVAASATVIMPPAPSFASSHECTPDGANDTLLGVPKWYKYLDGEEDGTGRCSPTIDSSAAALPIGLAVLEGMLRIAGLVAVAMVFVGSYKFIISVGNPEKTTGARKTIQNSLIGLVIVIISTAVISFVGGRLTGSDVGFYRPAPPAQSIGTAKV